MWNSRRYTDNHAVQQINKAEENSEEFFIGSIQVEKQNHPVSHINIVDTKKSGKNIWLSTRKFWKSGWILKLTVALLPLPWVTSESWNWTKSWAYYTPSLLLIQAKGKTMLTCRYKDKKKVWCGIWSNVEHGTCNVSEMGLAKRVHPLKTESDILSEYEDQECTTSAQIQFLIQLFMQPGKFLPR